MHELDLGGFTPRTPRTGSRHENLVHGAAIAGTAGHLDASSDEDVRLEEQPHLTMILASIREAEAAFQQRRELIFDGKGA